MRRPRLRLRPDTEDRVGPLKPGGPGPSLRCVRPNPFYELLDGDVSEPVADHPPVSLTGHALVCSKKAKRLRDGVLVEVGSHGEVRDAERPSRVDADEQTQAGGSPTTAKRRAQVRAVTEALDGFAGLVAVDDPAVSSDPRMVCSATKRWPATGGSLAEWLSDPSARAWRSAARPIGVAAPSSRDGGGAP